MPTLAMMELKVMDIRGKIPVARRSSVMRAKPLRVATAALVFSMGLPRSNTSPEPLVK